MKIKKAIEILRAYDYYISVITNDHNSKAFKKAEKHNIELGEAIKTLLATIENK